MFKKNVSNNTETENDHSKLKTTTLTQLIGIHNDQSAPCWINYDFTLFGTIGPKGICRLINCKPCSS